MDFYPLLNNWVFSGYKMGVAIQKKREGFDGQRLIIIPKRIVTNFLSKDPITKQLYITDIGYYPKARYHYAERHHGISQHIIIYCVDGSGWIEVGKRKEVLSPSQFVIIPANVPHRYGADEDRPWTIYWLHFKGDAADHLSKLALKNPSNIVLTVSHNEKRIRIFDDICWHLNSGFNEDTLRYVNMAFTYFISSIIYENKFSKLDDDIDTCPAERAIVIMEQKIKQAVTLPDLAHSVNLSVSHFCEVFRKKTGFAPIAYYNHLKIQKACQYLAFTQMSVKEIALALGFDDPFYFSRMFSRSAGLSPVNYRKRNSSFAQ